MRELSTRWLIRCALLLSLGCITSITGLGATCDRMQVTFKSGQLGIRSSGCSLQQVLDAVKEKTGIESETPASADAIPMTIDLEPGEPSTVLGLLLHDTEFNYAIIAGDANTPGKVILTERSAAPVVAAVPAAAPPPTDKPAVKNTTASNEPVNDPKDPKKSKDEKDAKVKDIVASAEDDTSAKEKPEIDEDTLKKLPQLPPGIPAAMWRAFPTLLQNGGAVPDASSTVTSGGSFTPTPAQAGIPAQSFYFEDPQMGPKGVVGMPTLPPELDPNMAKLYPWNLMQLIQGPIVYPNIKLPPMAPPIGVGTGH